MVMSYTYIAVPKVNVTVCFYVYVCIYALFFDPKNVKP